jgi:hypothetical protein
MHAAAQDPDGAYIARWVPELAALPKKWLHQPWLAPAEVLARAGVEFGAGPGCYPHRITTAVLQVHHWSSSACPLLMHETIHVTVLQPVNACSHACTGAACREREEHCSSSQPGARVGG